MSLNLFRTKMKKRKLGGHEKKNSDPTGMGIMASPVAGSYGMSSQVQFLGTSVKDPGRKPMSVPTDIIGTSPTHQPRKVSLPDPQMLSSSRTTPTSPLVNNKQSGVGSRDQVAYSALGGTSNGGTMFVTPLPKVVYPMDEAPLVRQEIIDITVNIQCFMAAISKLKKAMEESSDVQRTSAQSPDSLTNSEPGGDSSVASDEVRDHLTYLVEVVQTCLSEHQGMQSTEISNAARALSETYAECKHENVGTCTTCTNALEALITAFTNSVSEYLTGESPSNDSYAPPTKEPAGIRRGLERVNIKGLSKSHDNLSGKFASLVELAPPISDPIVEDIDHALFGVENSTEVAAKYIKIRMKYHKEVVSYLTKRAQIEQRYSNNIAALGKKTLATLMEMSEEHPPPLSDVFRRSVTEDLKLANVFNKTFNQQVTGQLIDPLEAKIQECDKKKKEMSNNWIKEKKKLNEAKTTMRNAMSRYRFLGQDLARVKNLLTLDPYGKQAEKRKKEVTDLEAKWQEAEQTYKKAVADCNDCQYQVHIAAQKSILCAYRRMVIDCDVQLQTGLQTYFKLQRNCFQSLPEPVDELLEEAGRYQVGSEFMSYISKHPEQREEPEDYLFEEFDPESENLMETNEYLEGSGNIPPTGSTLDPIPNPGAEDDGAASPFPSPSTHQDRALGFVNGVSSAGGKWGVSGGNPSPHMSKKPARPVSEVLEHGDVGEAEKTALTRRNSDHTSIHTGMAKDSLSPPVVKPSQPSWQQPHGGPRSVPYSKNALTHTFKKLRGPARCRECDTYVYFHGHECEICGLACHKKCLENLAIRCGNKRLARKMNTFGVDFHKHLKATNRCIPIIVTKCIEEIDERALDTRGLYRISSAKTKLEHLCQLFESGADRVDLSDRPSHLIGSCLKLYFRQLPEPLLTFQYYHDYITFARECAYILPCNLETVGEEKKERAREMLDRLKGLLQKLPFENYITLARLLYHLKKVSAPEHVKHNSMPPSNLGIVFGPNLLRQREMVASLALLADMTAQAKAIEIMISHAYDLFQMSEDKIKEHERETEDNFTQEVLVGGGEELFELPPEPIKSPLLDVDDYLTTGSRTPYNTPPERRRENVYELNEVLEALQSVGRKTENELHSPMRDNLSASMPSFSPFLSPLPKSIGSEESTLSNLSRYLRSSPAATTPNPVEKMLTPVEERPAAEREHDQDHMLLMTDDEDDDVILSSVSNKLDNPSLDNPSLSRSGSTFSGTGAAFFIESEKDASWEAGSIEGGKRSGELRLHDEQKGLSQSSEESNAFEENIPEHMRPILNEIASSAEETPLQKSLDSGTRQRHSVLSTSEVPFAFQRTNRGGGSPQKSQSLRGRYSGMFQQHQPPTPSSSCHSIIVVSASFSERSRSKKKYNISEKYAKYELCRSEKELSSKDKEEQEEKTKEESLQQPDEKIEPVVNPEQSDNPKTAGEVENDVADESADRDNSNKDANHSKDDDLEEQKDDNVEERKDDDMGHSPEGGMESLNKRILEVRETGATIKQCDSGIDDTPDSSKTFKDGVRRLSMPPSDDDAHMTDGKPLSQVAAFASRESGIADSPVPEVPSDDAIFRAQKSTLERERARLIAQNQLKKEADQEAESSCKDDDEFDDKDIIHRMGTPRHSSCVAIIVPEEGEVGQDRITPVVRRRVHSTYSVDRDRGSSVPRSLEENPMFSRYARKPIRDSKVLLRASDCIPSEGAGLRYRSVSMDKIPISYMDCKSLRENEEFLEFRQKVKSESTPSTSSSSDETVKSKHSSIPNSISASFESYSPPPQLLTGATAASGSGGKSLAIDGHPIARYSVTSPPDSLSPQNSPSHALRPTHLHNASTSSLPTETSFLSSPASSPVSRRSGRLGKGLKQKLKPALRVFKIASSSSIGMGSSEKLRQPPPIEEDEEGKDADSFFASTKSCPADERIENPEMRCRMRMVSPEAVEVGERLKIPSSSILRRSRSYEDMLDVESDNEDDKSSSTKIGGLVVVPEHKQKPRGGRGKVLLGKMMKRKSEASKPDSLQLTFKGSEVGKGIAGEPEKTPALLAYGYVAQSDGTGMKNPKGSKKRHRTPQYV